MTDSPRALAELLGDQANALLSSVLEHTHDGLMVADSASRIVWANPAYVALSGYPLETLVGNTPALLRPADVEVERSQEIWGALTTAGRFRGRLENQRADGSLFDADVSIVRLPPLASGVGLYLCTMRDVSADVALERSLAREAARAEQARDTTIFALSSLAEQRDPDAGLHLTRIEAYTRTLAEWIVEHAPSRLPSSARDPIVVGRCARLHDIGKVGVPDAVLLKKGPLVAAEQAVMRLHPRLGADILDRILVHQPESAFLRLARDIVAHHHEAFDGSGYPYGLRGLDIPLAAQLTTVADVLDALTSRRPYKPAHGFDESMRWITERSGTIFDPLAVEALVHCRNKLAAIHRELGDEPTDAEIRPSGIDPAESLPNTWRPPSASPSALIRTLHEAIADELDGDIIVRSGVDVGRIYVTRGCVAWADLTAEWRVLAECLVEEHGLSRSTMQTLIEESTRSDLDFGTLLVERGLITRERLHDVLRGHLVERVRALVALPDAIVHFVPHTRPSSAHYAFALEELFAEEC